MSASMLSTLNDQLRFSRNYDHTIPYEILLGSFAKHEHESGRSFNDLSGPSHVGNHRMSPFNVFCLDGRVV